MLVGPKGRRAHLYEPGGRRTKFSLDILLKLGPWELGDGDSECGIAGTVAIGDRDSVELHSWDSAEGLGQQDRVLCLYRRRMLRLCELTWRECTGKKKPMKQKNGNMRRSWRGFGGKGRWAHPSTGKVVVIQLIVEELLLRLWVPLWTRGVSGGGSLGQGFPYVPRDIVPKFPVECPPYVYNAWERRFEVFIANQGLRHSISPDAPEIAVISCINDAFLFGHFGEALVTEHRRVWGYICEATPDAPFENCLYECHSVLDALRTMREWALPLHPAERHLLVAELEGVQFMGNEDPKFFFARISRLETTMRAVGIKKSESNFVQIILRQLPERYNIVKIMTLADPQLTRSRLEKTIRSAYSQRKAHGIAK